MTDSSLRVSVCIPSCNHGVFLADAVESALNQEPEPREIVIADDASSDDSPAIIRRYESRNPNRVRAVFGCRRLGFSGNCNRLLTLCRGDIVVFLASDDLFLPDKLALQLSVFQGDPSVVLAYHAVEVFDSDSGEALGLMDSESTGAMTSAEELLRNGGIRNGCSVAIRRSAIPRQGFDVTLNGMADWLFQVEVALAGRAAWIPEALGRYRRHGNNMTNRFADFAPELDRMMKVLRTRYPERTELHLNPAEMERGITQRTTRPY